MNFSKKKVGRSVETCKFSIESNEEKYQKVRVCRLWEIHPKSIYKKLKKEIIGHYFMQPDDKIFELIRPIIKARPTYGYKRVTAMLNRQRIDLGMEKYNKKRIYRIMKTKGVILPKQART